MITLVQILVGGVLQGIVFGLIAVGFSLIYRISGVINLAQGAFAVFGALTMYSLQITFGWSTGLALLGAAAISAGMCAIVGAATFVPALGRLSVANVFILAGGLLTVGEGFCRAVWGTAPYVLPPFSAGEPFEFAGIRIPLQGLWLIATAILSLIFIWYIVIRTRFGLALRASADNATTAQLMGVNTRRMALAAFVLAGTLAAIAGIVVAPITSIQFDTGLLFTTFGFLGSTFGGLTSTVGAFTGGASLGVGQQLAAGYLSSAFANGISVAALLLLLVLRPNGLFTGGAAHRPDTREDGRVRRPIIRMQGRSSLISLVILAVVLLSVPLITSDRAIIGSCIIVGIMYLAVMGLDVLYGYAGQISLAQASFMAIGAYTSGYLGVHYGIEPIVGALVGIGLSLAAAMLLSLVTLRLRGHYLALATLSFAILVDSMTTGLIDITGGPSGLAGIPPFSIGSFVFQSLVSQYYFVVAIIIITLIMLMGAMRSGFGRALQSIRADETAAAALGINTIRYKLAAICIGTTLASLAGSLYVSHFQFISPEMVSTQQSFAMITMLVIGGEGTLIGGLLGVILLTFLPLIFQPLATYTTLFQGLLLVFALLWLPNGIFGSASLLWQRIVKPKMSSMQGRVRVQGELI